jgi:ribosomal protein S18 acetylase RimI-like enzyme
MKLHEELNKIKSLMFENFVPYEIQTDGDINERPGMHISVSRDNNKMGYVNLIDFGKAYHWDSDIPRMYDNSQEYCKSNCDDDFFNEENSLYLHDLRVLDNFKGQGLSHSLLDKCHEIAENLGIKYVLLITNCDNNVAQNLYKKHNYKIHQTDGVKDFYFKEI